MVRCLALAAALLLATSATAQTCAAPSCFEAPVVAVADGDTVTVLRQTTAGPRQVRVRLTEIDAPERGQPWGARARQALADKVFRQTVRVSASGEDRYGRLLARLYITDGDTLTGRDVNREMVREGTRLGVSALCHRELVARRGGCSRFGPRAMVPRRRPIGPPLGVAARRTAPQGRCHR